MLKAKIIVLGFLILMGNPGFSNLGESTTMEYVSGSNDPYQILKQAESVYRKSPKVALDLIEEALLMALRQNNLDAQAASYNLLGDLNFYLKQYDLAAANYQRALFLYERTSNIQQQLKMLLLSGRSYEEANDLDKALESYRAYVKLGDSSKISSTKKRVKSEYSSKDKVIAGSALDEMEEVRLAISEILIKQKKYSESVAELNDVAESADTIQYPEKSLIINDKLGAAYREQDMDDEAAEFYNRNRSTAIKLNKPREEAKATSNLADIYDDTEMTDEALALRNRSIEIYSLRRDSVDLAEQYLARGKLEKKLNRPSEAENSFKLALEYSEEGGDKQVESETYNEISNLEEQRGNLKKALEYSKKYVALLDAAFKERQEELEQTLQLNSSLIQQQNRIDLLEKNEEINDKTIEVLRANETITEKSATNQRLLIYGLLIVILLLSISGYLMYNNMQKKRVANQLLALKSLRSQMNPHFIFNALNSVNHYISQQDERAANKYLSDFSRLMRNVMENSQKDFISLSSEIEIIKLYLQLEHNRFSEKFDYQLEVDESLDKENIQIPPMLVQPYVENAIWHGLRYMDRKGNLSVKYSLQEESMRITVEDDGIGRKRSLELKTENQKKNNSTGMSNIESRVSIINQMYNSKIEARVVDLPNNSGTRIELVIPIKNSELST